MRSLVAIAVIACLASCSERSGLISKDAARKIATQHLNAHLRGKTFVDAMGRTLSYPQLEMDCWHSVEKVQGRWVLRLDPPDGVYGTVTVGERGETPKVESYGFALD